MDLTGWIVGKILSILWDVGIKMWPIKPELKINLKFFPPKRESHITMISPPNNGYKYWNVKYRLWYLSTDMKNFRPLTELLNELEYSKPILGHWNFSDKSDKIWLIFHFIDDYKENQWCYCKQFEWDDTRYYKWKEFRIQLRNKLTGKRHPVPCESCKFKHYWEDNNKELLKNVERVIDIETKSSMLTTQPNE